MLCNQPIVYPPEKESLLVTKLMIVNGSVRTSAKNRAYRVRTSDCATVLAPSPSRIAGSATLTLVTLRSVSAAGMKQHGECEPAPLEPVVCVE